MADSVTVKVVGLEEWKRALKTLDAELDRQLPVKLGEIAGQIASRIRGVMPRRSGWAASTVSSRTQGRDAFIGIGTGDPSNDYVPWLDFGGSVGRGHQRGPNMGAIHRPFVKEGRYLYPQIGKARKDIRLAVDQAIKEAAEHAGITTSGSAA